VNLENDNYYGKEASAKYFSVSQYKDFARCEAMALAKIAGEYQQPMTRAMLVGSFVDSYFEGTLDDFMRWHPEIYTRKNDLRSEFKKANEIINRIKSDKKFMKFLSGEKQRIIIFEMFGTEWKAKMDSYLQGKCITDLKIVANFRSIPFWRYDIQGAVYQKGVEIALNEKIPFYLAPATKERVIDIDIFQIQQETLDAALAEVEQNMNRYIGVKSGILEARRCGICDYCKQTKNASIRNYNELLEVAK